MIPKKTSVLSYIKHSNDKELASIKEEIEKELAKREGLRKIAKLEEEDRENSTDIFNLRISAKLYNILRNKQIKNLGQLQQWTKQEFLSLDKASTADLKKLETLMQQFNISFKN